MLFAIAELARHWSVIALRALATVLIGVSGHPSANRTNHVVELAESPKDWRPPAVAAASVMGSDAIHIKVGVPSTPLRSPRHDRAVWPGCPDPLGRAVGWSARTAKLPDRCGSFPSSVFGSGRDP